jgi:glycogen operon protein
MPDSLRSSASFDVWDRKEGTPGPMGVTWLPALQAWNFALYSRRATGVTLLLYGGDDAVRPILELRLDPRINKSGRIWHCWIPADAARTAAYYAYRVDGRYDPASGYCFNSSKILLDPFAPGVFFPPAYDRQAVRRPGAQRWTRAAWRSSSIDAPGPRAEGAAPAAQLRSDRL